MKLDENLVWESDEKLEQSIVLNFKEKYFLQLLEYKICKIWIFFQKFHLPVYQKYIKYR